jgi:HEAT repeat protein
MRAVLITLLLLTLPFAGVALVHHNRASLADDPVFVPPGPSVQPKPPPRNPAGRAPTSTLAQLLDDLERPNPDKRERAAHALGTLPPGPHDGEVALALAARLADPEVEVRWAADGALARLGPRAEPAIPALIAVLQHRQHKEWASTVLANIGTPAVPALRRALGHGQAHVRRSVAFALGAMGTDAREAAPDLRRLLRGERDRLVRRTAVWALHQVR